MRIRLVFAVLVSAVVGPPQSLAAQGSGTTVGVFAGAVRTTQIWKPTAVTDDRTAISAGGFADVRTPMAGVSVRAEGSYTQRGGDVVLDVAGEPTSGRLRVDYLTVAVHLKATRAFGPVRAHVALGPTLDQVLRRRLDPVLVQILVDEKAVVFGVAVGGGVGGWVSSRLFVGVDVRHVEGLGDAHAGNFTSARNRSLEVLLRAGIPLQILRDR